MPLARNLLFTCAGLVAFLMMVDWYDEVTNVPMQYEVSLTRMFYAVVLSVVILVATVALHFIGTKRSSKKPEQGT